MCLRGAFLEASRELPSLRSYPDARILRVDDHDSTPRIQYARPVSSASSRRTNIQYLLMVAKSARAQSATSLSFDKSARSALTRSRDVGTMRAVGPEQSERWSVAHGDRKSIGRESCMVREKPVTV